MSSFLSDEFVVVSVLRLVLRAERFSVSSMSTAEQDRSSMPADHPATLIRLQQAKRDRAG